MGVGMRDGEPETFDELFPLVYEELRHIAHRELGARPSDTLCTTALVHELYLKLAGRAGAGFPDRTRLLALSAVAMRYILVDRARRRLAEKRGGARRRVTLDDDAVAAADEAEWLIELDDALSKLGELDPRLVRVVEMRFFGGMTEEETAAAFGVTVRTVQRDWVKARGLLSQALRR